MPKTKSSTDCAFCQIVSRPKSASVVFQDDSSLCFLDQHPLFPGHCLLIPKQHIVTLMDVTDDLLEPLFANTRRIAAAVQVAMNSQGVFVAMNNIVSQSVPHLHIHVVPRNKGDGLKGFFWPRQRYRNDEYREQVRREIAQALR